MEKERKKEKEQSRAVKGGKERKEDLIDQEHGEHKELGDVDA